MQRTSVFTTITPLPAGVTRQSVVETYHNHLEMIDLNPLVEERVACKAPSYATAEESHSTWYSITDKVSYLPGNLATGSVTYHACFHDLEDGLQTHVYAPLGLDIRARWSVGGSMPGEPKAPTELGLGAPREGLYIREDVKMKCNFLMISFVKKTFKESHSSLVGRLVEKAHIIEAKAANERLNGLKTLDPRDRMGQGEIFIAPPPGHTSYANSTGNAHTSMYSNGNDSNPASPALPDQYNTSQQNRSSYMSNPPEHSLQHQASYQPEYNAADQRAYGQETFPNRRIDPRQQQYLGHEQPQYTGHEDNHPRPLQVNKPVSPPVELPGEPNGTNQKFAAELPG